MQQASNVRYLWYKCKFSQYPALCPLIEDLLSYYAVLCKIAGKESFKYSRVQDFGQKWKYNSDINCTFYHDLSDIVSHYRNAIGRLNSAIMTHSELFSRSGVLIDKINENIKLTNISFNAFSGTRLQRHI